MNEPEIDPKFEIIYENDTYLIVNKSGNIPVHEGGRYKENTLVRILEKEFGYRPFPVYRLDRETSGIVVFAKKSEYVRPAKITKKEYIGICEGEVKSQIINKPITETKGVNISWKKTVGIDGKPSITEVYLINSNKKYSLIKIIPKTGRQHQIRVHLEHILHPLLGDKIYGKSDKLFLQHLRGEKIEGKISRQALHLLKIKFFEKEITARIPEDICECIKKCGLQYSNH